MTQIHIADPAGRQTIYTLGEAHAAWRQGGISRDSQYWCTGMTDWRPAAEFFEANATGADSPFETQRPRGFVKDPARLTRITVVLLWLSLAFAVTGAIISAYAIATGRASQPETDELTVLDIIAILNALPQLLVFLVTAIIFLRWIHRANVNARGLGAEGLTFTPGWSVGWYFVPIAHLWKPYQAMKQIWQASRNPDAWRTEAAPTLLSTWWFLWITSNLLGQMSFRLSLRDGTDVALVSEVCSLLSDLIDIPLCLVAMRLVKSIYQMQKERAEQPS